MTHMSNRNVKVKICGVTLPEQAREISSLGVDYIGCIIEFPKSLRSVSRVRARELQDALKGSKAILVGVTVDMPIEKLIEIIKHVGLKIVQLHGDESVEYVKRLKEAEMEVWKVVTRENYRQYAGIADKLLVDAKNPLHGAGGSGKLSDWNFAKELVDKGFSVVLSGGLNPNNIQEGIKLVRPLVVDLSSGVEETQGVKDISKVKDFIRNAKAV